MTKCFSNKKKTTFFFFVKKDKEKYYRNNRIAAGYFMTVVEVIIWNLKGYGKWTVKDLKLFFLAKKLSKRFKVGGQRQRTENKAVNLHMCQ